MSLKINGFNISKMKINNSNISLAKINGSIVFQLDNNIIITLTFTDKTIKAVSNKTGNYDFYYASDDEIINDYDKIVSFSLTANIEKNYTYLNSFNIAPYDATKIVVCEGGTTQILSSSSLPSQFLFDSSSYGQKLYSFGALSDVHIDGDGTDEASASSDLVRALTFFNSNASLVCISGDLSINDDYGELSTFKELVDNNANISVYASRGNHDCRDTIDNWNNIGYQLYYEQTYNNDIFIFLGMNAENYADSCFTTEELDWLETKLESYKNQRVFLFFHVFMPDTCGNINNLYPYSSLDTSSTIIQRFISLMTTYKNVIYFSGHSHLEFACQKFGENANIFSDGSTCHRVHIPSCAVPRKNDTGTSSSNTYDYDDGSQGYLVDVYDNCIVLRGIDFEKGKFLPIANYLLDTNIITNSFSAANIITVDDGSEHSSPYVSAGITYTFTEGSPRIITDGTPENNTVQGFKQKSILQSGRTYKIWVDNKQGECDLAGQSYSFKLMVSDDYVRTTEYAKCYVDPADESSNPSSATFTPTSDITEWYLMIQQRPGYVTLSDYSFDIHVEEVKSQSIITSTNLLDLSESNWSWVSYEGTEASVDYNSDNTLTVTADGSSSWGLNISQPGLTLSAGTTYRLSCDNIGSSTWISVNNDDNKMLHSDQMSVDFTPSTDKVDPVIYIWVNSGIVYDNVVWNITLEEI